MNNTLKIFAVAVVAAIAVFFIMDDDDIGDNLEEAANDAGREIEDITD